MRTWGDTQTMRTMKILTIKGYMRNEGIGRVVKKVFYILLGYNNDKYIIKVTGNLGNFGQRGDVPVSYMPHMSSQWVEKYIDKPKRVLTS